MEKMLLRLPATRMVRFSGSLPSTGVSQNSVQPGTPEADGAHSRPRYRSLPRLQKSRISPAYRPTASQVNSCVTASASIDQPKKASLAQTMQS